MQPIAFYNTEIRLSRDSGRLILLLMVGQLGDTESRRVAD
jgi:hypothetical protein